MVREWLGRFNKSSVAFLDMILLEFWITRKILCVVFILAADVALTKGMTSTAELPLPSNFSIISQPSNSSYDLLNSYLDSDTKSRELEEAIYSDIINNIKSLIQAENNQFSEVNFFNGYKTQKDNKVRLEDSFQQLNSTKINLTNSNKKNVFLNGANEFIKKEVDGFANYIPRNHQKSMQDEFLLGYSGSPFGSHKLRNSIALPEAVELERERETEDPRKKRSVVHLYNMVLCATGCNPLSYKGYGCYCGFLGSGFVVDGIDSCCKMHDWCYNSAGCPMFLEYFIPYLWKCYHHQPLCAIDHIYYGGPGSCAQRLCECDRQLAMCLRRYPCPTTKALCTSSPWRLLQNILML